MKGKRAIFGVCCMVCTMLVSGCGAEKESAELPAVDRTEEVDGTEIYRDILDDFYTLISNGSAEEANLEGREGILEAVRAMEGERMPLTASGTA